MEILVQAVAQLEMLIKRANKSGDMRAKTVLMLAQAVLLEPVLKTASGSEERDTDDTSTPYMQ